MIKQISAFIENKPGRLAEVTGFLADAGISIHALSIADTTDFGILRMIVGNPELARDVLKKNGLTVKVTDVCAVAVENQAGSLHKLLCELERVDIAIEYMYAFTSRSSRHEAMIILRLANQEKVIHKLKECNIQIVEDDIFELIEE